MSTTPAPSPWIVDVTLASFPQEVVEKSRKVPVFVDFWATWCGPCKVLTPLLEKLAREGNGRFVLAKVDSDKNPELSQYFQVQAVPTVLIFQGGQVLDGFQGALPERELRALLDQIAPLQADEVARAKELEHKGDRAGAIKLLRQVLRDHADLVPARIALAGMLAADGKIEEARLVFQKLSEADQASAAAAGVRAQLDLAGSAGELDAARAAFTAQPSDLRARVAFGKALLGARKYEDGLEQLLEAVREDARFEDGAARKAMIEAFDALGHEHPTTIDFRGRLQMLLMV
jgi:putative thioredoxin